MSELYINILLLLEKKGVSGYKMCKDIGIRPSILSDLKSGRKKGLHAETAQKIADYLGVSVNRMMNYRAFERMDQQFKGYDIGAEAERMHKNGYELNPNFEEDGIEWIKIEQTEKSSTPEGAELEFTDMELLNAYKVADDVTKELIRRALGLK